MNEVLEAVRCNLCGADRPDVIYPARESAGAAVDLTGIRSSGDEPLRHRLVRCGACGLVYVSPRLDSSLMLQGYSDAVDEAFVSQAKGREATFRRCVEILHAHRGAPPGTLLDVGTANGSFLKVARDAGWTVSGVEVSAWMCRWCEEHYGIKVHRGTIFDARFDDAAFDVVTLWDVLEHTPDPQAVLRECARVLKPGGLLVVNYPDYGSAVARLMRRRWVFLLTVHYYYYTRATIRRALEAVGCDVVRARPHVQSLEFGYLLSRAGVYVGGVARVLGTLARWLRLDRLQIPYWMGQTLVVARKRS